jgi:hypothetical protein
LAALRTGVVKVVSLQVESLPPSSWRTLPTSWVSQS